ncbi:MAG: c-type cytochrome [Methylovirgula sp.]
MSARFPIRERRILALALASAALGLVAFGARRTQAADASAPSTNRPLKVPVTQLFPGGGSPPPQVANAKKYEGNPVSIAAGKAIFNSYNCAGCHFHGAGGMGPPFMNGGHWIYGGKIDQIFASIYQGRPNGMPSWGRTIPAPMIWDLAAYVKALSQPSERQVTGGPPLPRPHPAVSGGNAQHGAELVTNNGCGACHQIRGIPNAVGKAGPPLNDIAARSSPASCRTRPAT